MREFLKLTDADDNKPILLRKSDIIAVSLTGAGYCRISCYKLLPVIVNESMKDIEIQLDEHDSSAA